MTDEAGSLTPTRAAPIALRAPEPADAGPIGMWLSDPEVARNLTQIPHPYPPGAAETMVERALAGKRAGPLWVMARGDEPVGLVFVNAASGEGAGPQDLRIGYMVGPPWRNTGCATEGVAAAVDALFDAGAETVTANVFTDNQTSARVLTRVGFAYEGDGMEWSAGRGAAAPCWRYRLTRAARAAARDRA
ncbi:GNAT family N-acetyltransferase [Rhodovulum sp. DZ06]|uniref:GNAT family N-acetyltransferase n=1 Tax=Rhodovulum sp. DZ06 TaxID=3425126 RepID=UPI003D346D9F